MFSKTMQLIGDEASGLTPGAVLLITEDAY